MDGARGPVLALGPLPVGPGVEQLEDPPGPPGVHVRREAAADEAGRDEAWLASWLFQTQRQPKEGGPSYRILESV